MKKKWIVGTVLIALLLILFYWIYRQQDTYHLIRSIIKNNPYCEAFQVNKDGSKTEYTVEIDDLGWGVWKKIEGLSFDYQGEKIEYRIALNDYTKIADATPGEESRIRLFMGENSSGKEWYGQHHHFKVNKVKRLSHLVNKNEEWVLGVLDDSELFPEEIEDIFKLIEDDIQKRAQKCWY